MEPQLIINSIFGVLMLCLGWILKVLWDAICELQKTDKDLAEKVGKIEVLVAGQYVKVDRFDQMVNAIFAKLDKIDNKLDQKVDKQH